MWSILYILKWSILYIFKLTFIYIKEGSEEINQLKEQLDREKKEQLNEIEKLKNELEKEKSKGFFARLFGK